MKTKILIFILCLACAASYGQTRKRRRNPKPAATARQVKVDTTTSRTRSALPPAVDTSRKMAAKPGKPFDRPVDGYFKKTDIMSAKVTPYAAIRESDAAYVKRVWREIDVREKMNQYLASPKQRLIDVLLNAISDGELTAYDPTQSKDDPDGDGFSVPLSPGQASSKLVDSTTVPVYDANGNQTGSRRVANVFNPDSVVKFRLKEDWIFDKQRSVFEPRIIGIAPLIRSHAGGQDFGYVPAFWIYFPDARPILATKEVVMEHNDNTGLSFDDIFMKRIFTSYIVKESNEKDESIKDYAQGIDKLYEADRIKESLRDWELSLWQY